MFFFNSSLYVRMKKNDFSIIKYSKIYSIHTHSLIIYNLLFKSIMKNNYSTSYSIKSKLENVRILKNNKIHDSKNQHLN